MKKVMSGIVLLGFLWSAVYGHADLCFWTDDQGVRHFSNTGDCPEGAEQNVPEAQGNDRQVDDNRQGLKFMGVYKDGMSYLRFYPDGTVISVNTQGTPEQLKRWFGKSKKYAYKGEYSQEPDGRIAFYAIYEKNEVLLYKGVLHDDVFDTAFYQISTTDKGRIKEKRYGEARYRFFPVDFERGNRY